MSDLPPAASKLVEANLLFLAHCDPALADRLRALNNALTRPVIDGDAVIDIDVGGGRLYGRPADEFAAAQIASYKVEPARVLVRRPDPDGLQDPCAVTLVRGIEDRLAAKEIPLLAVPPVDRSGFLLVLGVGLGKHLEALIEWAGPRHVVLVEPIDEFLRHSLATVDWAALHEACFRRGAQVHIIARDNMADILVGLDHLFAKYGETLLDTTYIYMHYATPVIQEVANKMREYTGIKTILKGYFADELLMIDNTSANVATHPFRLVEGALQLPLDAPAFIVGAGPSLDESVATIARERDNAVIFTAGSALQALLHAGIVPDYHVEKENQLVSVERLRHIMARNSDRFPDGKFTGVKLLASTTVDPGVLDLFDDKYLFLRTALSSTVMFGDGHDAMDKTSPYSANAALTLAAVLGFREIYLFGCDCGTRDAGRHHSAETVYYTGTGAHAATKVSFEDRHVANFGGEVLTNPYFNWSRIAYEQVIIAAGLTVYNCSDGACIGATTPLRPADLSLAGRGLDRSAIDQLVAGRCTSYPAGGLLEEQDVAGAMAAWHDTTIAVRKRLAELRQDRVDVHTWYAEMAALFRGLQAHSRGTGTMLAGTARTAPTLASYYFNRIADPADVADMFSWFLDTCDELFEEQLAIGGALMDTVAERAGIVKKAIRGIG